MELRIKIEGENKLDLILALHAIIQHLGKNDKLDFDELEFDGKSSMNKAYHVNILKLNVTASSEVEKSFCKCRWCKSIEDCKKNGKCYIHEGI